MRSSIQPARGFLELKIQETNHRTRRGAIVLTILNIKQEGDHE